MLDPRRLLATYNAAVGIGKIGKGLPLWSKRLLSAVAAEPAKVVVHTERADRIRIRMLGRQREPKSMKRNESQPLCPSFVKVGA